MATELDPTGHQCLAVLLRRAHSLTVINQSGVAPSWDEIARVGHFVEARHNDAIDFDAVRLNSVESFDSDPQLRDRMDRHISVMNRVNELTTAPTAEVSGETEPPESAADDSAIRRSNYTALVAMAGDFRTHPDWDPGWDPSVV